MATTLRLTTELETYNRERTRLAAESEGKYVLIHGSEVAGVWDTYEDALKAGYQQFKLEPFLVKQIQSVDQVFYFARDIALCPC
jgi:hypothetical protein